MARSLFALPEARKRLGEAVEAVEARSSAEVVVAVRPWSARYTGADCIAGAVVAELTLLYTLYAPQVFDLHWIALVVPAGFLVGFALSRLLLPLRTLLTGAARMQAAVEQGARACFTELGVSATRERSGILVYVSLTERRCVVIPDVGIVANVPEDEWAKAKASVESAVATHGIKEPGLAALCTAVQALGDTLEAPMPRADDDIDELENVA